MTQEEKQLLLNDLCAKLPYGVKVSNGGYIPAELSPVMLANLMKGVYNIKPYLRPTSSMTEYERNNLKAVACPNGTGYFNEQYLVCPINHFGEQISFDFMSDIIDWLNAHYFDYRGLIPMGLALEAPVDMYKTE